MKKLSLIALMVLTCIVASAQTSTLVKLEEAGNQLKNMTATFKETDYMAVPKKTVTLDGTMYFANGPKMSLKYKQADQKELVINESMFYMRLGKKSLRVNTDSAYAVRQHRNVLIYCMQGKLRQLAADQGLSGKQQANIITSEDGQHYVITLVSKQKDAYYSKIKLLYSKENNRLVMMRTEKMGGDYTIYEFSNIDEEAEIDPMVFALPQPKKNASANKSK
ncbi:MAG: outer membrane lipoprotein carrier protein LolA [Paludibacteraceae bacterium]|nr:outer membrane lipoprotein carrier protein LolA [Paludibacteraceae bacterium]